MSQPETIASNAMRLDVGRLRRHVRLFRNHAGTFWAGRVKQQSGTTVLLEGAQRIQGGLTTGAGDLVGWVSVTVTPAMVGQRVAIFIAPDVKVGRRKLETDQATWRDNVVEAGGLAAAVYSSADLIALIDAAPGRPA